jgi:hypothetical protein
MGGLMDIWIVGWSDGRTDGWIGGELLDRWM